MAKRILALIPARGGSKGVPGKNTRKLHGKPLIDYTIETARDVARFDRVIVSTDDEGIANVAEEAGCPVPFLRPRHLATDSARTVDAVLYTLDRLRAEQGETYDTVCLLQPTTPLRSVEDVHACLDIMASGPCRSVVSVQRIDEPHPHKLKIIRDGLLEPFLEGTDSSVPRQELPAVYGLNGAQYVVDVEALQSIRSFFADPCKPYVMPWERSVNIDSLRDFRMAELLLEGSR